MKSETMQLTREQFAHKIESMEAEVLKLSGLELESIRREYSTIQVDGKPFRVRVLIVETPEDRNSKLVQRPTILLTHCYFAGACLLYRLIKPLSTNLRLVLVDHSGFGANTRVFEGEPCSGLGPYQEAEKFIGKWWHDLVTALTTQGDLPPNFYLAGHSNGGYQLALYASMYPQRVRGYFGISPGGMLPLPEKYNPFEIRVSSESQGPPPKEITERALQNMRERRSLLHRLQKEVPESMRRDFYYKKLVRDLAGNRPQSEQDTILPYIELVNNYYGLMERVIPQHAWHWPFFAIHSMQSSDRLGNPSLPFPIAMAYGDRDILGSEGSDSIIKGNSFFKSGESQIFKIQNCGHHIPMDQPEECARLITGFISGKIKFSFEEKPYKSFPEKEYRAKL